MDFRENLIWLRKGKGWSQEELGYRLDVSRQTVSKWESGDTTPEMAKLVKMSELFQISLDNLINTDSGEGGGRYQQIQIVSHYEYKSRRTFKGFPLVHINIGRGFRRAKGIVAVGNIATGVVAVGGAAAGLISFGAVSIGLLGIGALVLGVISCGALAAGFFAAGGVAAGYLAVGGVASGIYTVGGVSLARDIAVGGFAKGYIAIGESVQGTVQFVTGDNFSGLNSEEIKAAIVKAFPDIQPWILRLFSGMVN